MTADEGFTLAELEDYAQFIKQDLITADDVAKVKLFGVLNRVVNVYISDEKVANAGITPADIQNAFASQNQLINTGVIKTGRFNVRLDAVGTFQSIQELEDLVITGKSGNQIRLKDLATTVIATLSFLPLYMAPSNTAEIIKPLFTVLAIALTLSWIFALIQTTVYGDFILKEPASGEGEGGDPFDTPFYRKLTAFIETVIEKRYLTLGAVVVVFIISLFLFKYVKQDFFPAINKPMFGGMAVAIMGGLFVATILTIVVLPAFYSAMYNLKKEPLD